MLCPHFRLSCTCFRATERVDDYLPLLSMSVDGHLIADVQRLRQLGEQSLFFLLVGSKGAGKSTALQSFVSGLSVTTKVRHAAGVHDIILTAPAAASPDDDFTLWTLTYAAVAHSSSSLGVIATYALSLRPFSIVVVDDIDLLWLLCSINGLLPLLQRLLQAALTSSSCVIVASAPSQDTVPAWLLEQRLPALYPLRELTEAGMRRLLRSVPQPLFKSHVELLSGAQTLSTSRQMLLFNACMTLEAAAHGVTGENLRSLARENCAFLHHRRSPAVSQWAPPHLYGLSEARHRISTLVSVFTAHSSPGGGDRLLASLLSSTGLLLHGPSGCGKSSLARQLASDFPSMPFFFVECTRLFSKYLGESEEQLRDVYRRARARTPAVVVLEDLDVIAQSRGVMRCGDSDQGTGNGKGQLDVTRRMLAGLLCELDGVIGNSGVLTIGITNAPQVLDAAVLRQGRLETLVYIPPLTHDGAEELCAHFFQRFDGAEGQRRECAMVVANHAVGCAPASLQYVLRKVFEASALRHGWDSASAGSLPLPTIAAIQGHLFESCSILQRVNHLHFE
ncbi:putative ATPase family associated with various cellular activities (AAA) [Leishmania shawi]|uniref:ATPase family associated with various cellular activities (AAA) n=1 Tax=Leishmania shawi TaxID=5680 RepID=A0AAW3BNE6_9TRYP